LHIGSGARLVSADPGAPRSVESKAAAVHAQKAAVAREDSRVSSLFCIEVGYVYKDQDSALPEANDIGTDMPSKNGQNQAKMCFVDIRTLDCVHVSRGVPSELFESNAFKCLCDDSLNAFSRL
jgi:hypothetical protein